MNKDWTELSISFLQKSIIPIAVVVVLSIVAGGAYTFMKSQSEKKIEKASSELFDLQKELAKKGQEMAPEPEIPEMAPNKAPAKTKKPKPTVEQLQQAYEPSVAKLQAFIKANSGIQPAVEAALLVSEAVSEYHKYDEGISALQTALKGFDEKNFLFGVAQNELGSLLAQANKCQEAVQAWEKAMSKKDGDLLSDQLRLKSGVCYEKLGMYDKAEKYYKEIIQKSPESFTARTAKRFLLHLQYVKSKNSSDGSAQKNG